MCNPFCWDSNPGNSNDKCLIPLSYSANPECPKIEYLPSFWIKGTRFFPQNSQEELDNFSYTFWASKSRPNDVQLANRDALTHNDFFGSVDNNKNKFFSLSLSKMF